MDKNSIELNEDVIYQDDDGTWMVQPAYKEGWLVEPHALYPQPTISMGMDPLNVKLQKKKE